MGWLEEMLESIVIIRIVVYREHLHTLLYFISNSGGYIRIWRYSAGRRLLFLECNFAIMNNASTVWLFIQLCYIYSYVVVGKPFLLGFAGAFFFAFRFICRAYLS